MLDDRLLKYEILESACVGDPIAMDKVLLHYDRYIDSLSIQAVIDADGTRRMLVNDDIKSQLQSKLIAKTLAFRLDD